MSYIKPTPFIDYVPARLSEGKEWTVVWYSKDPLTGKLIRFRRKFNRIKQVSKRRAAARAYIAAINEKLVLGWNPASVAIAPRAGVRLLDALDSFLKAKQKETEENSMRCYRSFIRTFKQWLADKGMAADAYVCSFTSDAAIDYMEDIESRENISARTYNNYLLFFRLLFNWMIEREYISDNPFERIKRKPKRLTKKKRRVMTDEELEHLFAWLADNNRNYLCMALMCYCCFLRPKELALLRCGDVDIEHQVIHIREEIAKNDNDSYRTIPDVVVPVLAWLDLSNPSYYLFGLSKNYSFNPSNKQVCSRKIAKYWADFVRPACKFSMDIQFYSLKDSGVTRMLEEKVPINLVQKQADHSSVAMTAIYLGQLPEANDKLKKVNLLDFMAK